MTRELRARIYLIGRGRVRGWIGHIYHLGMTLFLLEPLVGGLAVELVIILIALTFPI